MREFGSRECLSGEQLSELRWGFQMETWMGMWMRGEAMNVDALIENCARRL